MVKKLENVINEAIEYAKKGNWNIIDQEIIPRIPQCESSEVVSKIYSLFDNKNENVRDLAGTIADKINIKHLSQDEVQKLKTVLQKTLSDTNIYAGFRSAIALVDHDLQEKDDILTMKEIFEKIKETEENKEIKSLAMKYLEKLKFEEEV